MAGAYILAGELKQANGDYQKAFRAYEARFKPFIDQQQKKAEQPVRWEAPRTQSDLWLRNLLIRMMGVPLISKLLINRFADVVAPYPGIPSDFLL